MRAVPILATLAFADIVLVALGGADPGRRLAADELRNQLLSTVAFAGAGCVALALLSWLTRVGIAHLRGGLHVALGVAIGVVYALALVGFVAWSYLWMTPTYYPVALVCGASALLLAWQARNAAADAPVMRRGRGGE